MKSKNKSIDIDTALDLGYFREARGYIRSPCDGGWVLVYDVGQCPYIVMCYQFELNNLCLKRLD